MSCCVFDSEPPRVGDGACRLRLLAGDGVRVPNHPCVLVAGLCDESDPEYELRFDADEEYVRELIDWIDEMSLTQ